MRWSLLSSGVLLFIFSLTFAGCGKKESTADNSATTNSPSTSNSPSVRQASDPATAPHRLVGIWFGQPTLNQQALQQKLSALPDGPEKEQLTKQAQSFLSTVIGAQFNADQTMDLDMMITATNGEEWRGESTFTWRVVSEQQNTVTIETIEQFEDKQGEPEQVLYTFSEPNQFVFAPSQSLSSILKEFQPAFVFSRQAEVPSEEEVRVATSTEDERTTGNGQQK